MMRQLQLPITMEYYVQSSHAVNFTYWQLSIKNLLKRNSTTYSFLTDHTMDQIITFKLHFFVLKMHLFFVLKVCVVILMK